MFPFTITVNNDNIAHETTADSSFNVQEFEILILHFATYLHRERRIHFNFQLCDCVFNSEPREDDLSNRNAQCQWIPAVHFNSNICLRLIALLIC